MKNIIPLLVIAAITSGCAAPKIITPHSVALEKFDISSTKINNPIDIKPDVIASIRDMISTEMAEHLQGDEIMTLDASCATAAYRIEGKISKIYTQMKVFGVNRYRMEIDAEAWLKKCSDGSVVAHAKADDTDNDIGHVTRTIAGDLVESLGEKVHSQQKP